MPERDNMAVFGEWRRRLWYLLNRRRIARDLEREMEIHRALMRELRVGCAASVGTALRTDVVQTLRRLAV